MKIAAYALSAALLGLMSITPASALPSAAAGHATVQTDGVKLINHKPGHGKYGYGNTYKGKKHYGSRKHYGPRNQFRPGGRYSKAPRGWHRYHKRPGNWNTRGCIVVGPVWFCP